MITRYLSEHHGESVFVIDRKDVYKIFGSLAAELQNQINKCEAIVKKSKLSQNSSYSVEIDTLSKVLAKLGMEKNCNLCAGIGYVKMKDPACDPTHDYTCPNCLGTGKKKEKQT